MNKDFLKNPKNWKKIFFWIFTKLRPETESWNGGDHELWNHEMRGFPDPCTNFMEKWKKGGEIKNREKAAVVYTAERFVLQETFLSLKIWGL